MGFTSIDLMAIFPNHLCLEVTEHEQEHTWQWVMQQPYSNPVAHWNVYLNQLCLNCFLSWLRSEEFEQQHLLHLEVDTSVWEVVNGTMLTVNQTRLVLLPDDKSNLAEFCVPQEWIDIPAWAADCYLAVQLNLEEGWLRVWGYATGNQIHEQATYERIDQTYCLDVEDLIPSLNVMWVTQEICPSPLRKIQALPTFSSSQVEPLLVQLSHATAYSPRLTLPFPYWAAIVASDDYRLQLYRLRLKQGVTALQVTLDDVSVTENLVVKAADE